MRQRDLIVVGGGPAGLAAAVAARENGIEDILIVERDQKLGGILNQCIHNGFGLHTFKEELTGPEYAQRFIDQIKNLRIPYMVDAMVIDISPQKVVTIVNKEMGLQEIAAKAVILCMGCRERPRGALNIPGYRPAGIYTAGTAQRLVNINGVLPGREIVILGSGDIGLIMARRMMLEGAKVKVVAELMPYSSGLRRNIVQCLDDYGCPLKLSHTVVDTQGKERVEGVTLAEVDENGVAIRGTEKNYKCDTLLLSCGLLPENELSRGMGLVMNSVTNGPVVDESLETSIPGVYACGNVLHVHDLVDYVSEEAKRAGAQAADYIHGVKAPRRVDCGIQIYPEFGIRYTVPSVIYPERMPEELTVRFRVGQVFKNCYVDVYFNETRVIHRKRQVMMPGEMEQVSLSRSQVKNAGAVGKISFRVKQGGV